MNKNLLIEKYDSILDSLNMVFLVTSDEYMEDRINEAMSDFEYMVKVLRGKEQQIDTSKTVEEYMESTLQSCIGNLEDALNHMNKEEWRYSKTVEEQLNIVIPLMKQVIKG
ncbi:hypothetical protein P9X10_02935 [Bacillus cereus]|nr:hypothetical protein [Bacillus cereus]